MVSECHVRGMDLSAKAADDDDDDDNVFNDPSKVRLVLQTKDSKAKKCSLVIFKVADCLPLFSIVYCAQFIYFTTQW